MKVLAPKTILDFGCGRSKIVELLSAATGAKITRHDPAIPEFSAEPEGKFYLLTNFGVLEHVPEDSLDAVVGKMAGLCHNAIIVIDTRPAEAVLPNGENAHCTLGSHDWWQQYLSKHFDYVEPIRVLRRYRAAFRTWKLSPGEEKTLNSLLLREKVAYLWGRLIGRK